MLQLARQRPAMSARLQSKDPHGRGDRSATTGARAGAGGSEFRTRWPYGGLIGYGHVGRAIARLCSVGLAMNVLAQTRSDFTDGKLWAQRVPLSELLQISDFVVLACPLTPQTRALLGAAELALMKPAHFWSTSLVGRSCRSPR